MRLVEDRLTWFQYLIRGLARDLEDFQVDLVDWLSTPFGGGLTWQQVCVTRDREEFCFLTGLGPYRAYGRGGVLRRHAKAAIIQKTWRRRRLVQSIQSLVGRYGRTMTAPQFYKRLTRPDLMPR